MLLAKNRHPAKQLSVGVNAFHEKAGQCQERFSFLPILPKSAASAAILPSELFDEQLFPRRQLGVLVSVGAATCNGEVNYLLPCNEADWSSHWSQEIERALLGLSTKPRSIPLAKRQATQTWSPEKGSLLPGLSPQPYNRPLLSMEAGKAYHMAQLNKLSLIATTIVVTTSALHSARAAEPPADLCSLLPAAELSKTLGQTYDSPQKSIAPRPFPNTAEGTDCTYKRSKDARERKLLFRAYVDPSPSAAADLFARLSKFFGPPTPITGVGDQAYLDKHHGLHVLRGKVRFFIAMDDFTPAIEKQLENLASQVAGRL